MGTNDHARERVKTDHVTPPSKGNRSGDQDHALRAGQEEGGSARKSAMGREPSTRDEGRDDRRSGSDSNR